MKKTMKLASFIFALTLAVSVVLTGCGNGRKDSTTKGTTENNNASNTTEDNLVDDAEDAVDDVADGVGDAVEDVANGFDNYDDAHDYLLNRLQTDDKDGKYEVRNETRDEQEYKDGAFLIHNKLDRIFHQCDHFDIRIFFFSNRTKAKIYFIFFQIPQNNRCSCSIGFNIYFLVFICFEELS